MSEKKKNQADRVMAYLRKNPGTRAGAVAKATGINVIRVCTILKGFTDEGKATRTGERTKYAYTATAAA